VFLLTRSLIDSLRAAGCVFAEQEAELLFEAATSPQDLSIHLARRVAGEPLEHVVGWATFCGDARAGGAGGTPLSRMGSPCGAAAGLIAVCLRVSVSFALRHRQQFGAVDARGG